jgi:hypothetical protein
MFAVVVRESGDPKMIDGSRELVETNVVPRTSKAPGFVSAVWMTDRAGGTLNVLVFESEETASTALTRVREAPRPGFMRLESVDLYEVLADARS